MGEQVRLRDVRVAIIASDMFEEVEMTRPRKALEEEGAATILIAPTAGRILAAKHFDKAGNYDVDETLQEADLDDYDAPLLPGVR